MSSHSPKNEEDSDAKLGLGCLYVKVSMDGAPYLRKVDLKTFSSYTEFSSALEKMFSCFTIGNTCLLLIPASAINTSIIWEEKLILFKNVWFRSLWLA